MQHDTPSQGYLHDANDYYTSTLSPTSVVLPTGCEKAGINGIVDLTKDGGPAYGLNGTMWEDYLFMTESLSRINDHNASQPLFLLHAFHSVHTPLNPPKELEEPYKHFIDPTRRAYAAMTTFVDTSIGQVVTALKDKGMWDNTVLVVSSDNGGPIYPSPTHLDLFGGATNLPLRGGKTSDWEGGIRVNALLGGGYLPARMRGREIDDYIHMADWYATFCALAGVSPQDEIAEKYGLPRVDSLNQWPLLSGEVAPGGGERTQMHISPVTLIEGRWKLLMGSDPGNINKHTKPGVVPFNVYGVGYGFQAFLNFLTPGRNCMKGCLYDIQGDPTESNDVAQDNPELLQNMTRKLSQLNQGIFNPNRGSPDLNACYKMQQTGYYAPFAATKSNP